MDYPMTKDNEAKRFGIYYDAEMLEDELLIKQELDKLGLKHSRAAIVRYALRQEANRIRKTRKKGG